MTDLSATSSWPSVNYQETPFTEADAMRALLSVCSVAITLLLVAVPEPAAAPPAGSTQVVLEGGKKVSGTLILSAIKIKTDLGTLEVDITRVRSIAFGKEEDSVTTASSTIKGKIVTEEFKLRTEEGTLTLDRTKLQSITFAAPVVTRDPFSKDPPGKDIPADNQLEPAAVIKLDAVVPSLVFSKDRKQVYFLNLTHGKIQSLDVARRALRTESAEVTKGTEGLCLTPNGKVLYTFASPAGHKYYDNKNPEVGKIQVFEPGSLKLQSTFALDFDPYGIAANDAGRIFLTNGSNQWTTLAFVDVGKQAIAGKLQGVRHLSILRMSPDQRRLYWSSTDISPGNVHTALLPSPPSPAEPKEIAQLVKDLDSLKFAERDAAYRRLEEIGELALDALRKAVGDDPNLDYKTRLEKLIKLAEQRLEGKVEHYRSRYHGDYPLGGRFEVTADSKHLVFATGIVLRAGLDREDDLKYLAKIEPHAAAATDTESKHLLIATGKQVLHAYSYPDFKLQKSFLLPAVAYQMLFDPASGTLICAVDTQKKGLDRQQNGRGDLHVYDLKAALEKLQNK